jgi:hypothetical protein
MTPPLRPEEVGREKIMDPDTYAFCAMIRNRSGENRRAMHVLAPHRVISPAFSLLRQELDSMVRVIYLLHLADQTERQRLIKSTLQGERWKLPTPNGKFRDVTDREMVDNAQRLQGWTQSVYKFGCAFVHLSDFHNYFAQNPFQKLPEAEREDILTHMRRYHGGPSHDDPEMSEIAEYLPRVFDKIADNLNSYLEQLER